MKIKKIIAALLSAVMIICSFAAEAIPAAAASSKFVLIKVPFSSISSRDKFYYLGKNIYATSKGFVRIGSEEMKEWRNTGKLKPTKISTDYKFPPNWQASGKLDKGDYIIVDTLDDYRNVVNGFTLLKYNKKKNEFKVVRSYRSGAEKYVTPDGYVALQSQIDVGSDSFTVGYDTPDGKTVKKTFQTCRYTNDGQYAVLYDVFFPESGKYLYICFTLSEEQPSQSNPQDKVYRVKILGVDKKGNEYTLADYYSSHFNIIHDTHDGDNHHNGMLGDNVFYSAQVKPEGVNYYLSNSKTGMTVNFNSIRTDYSKTAYNGMETVSGEISTIRQVVDNKAVAYYDPYGQVYYGAYGFYRLIDVSSGSASYIGESYKDMYTDPNGNGKIYYVEDFNGKKGYMDSTGKLLKTFDDAYYFWSGSKYAPVRDGNTVYLVDKKMNRVSDKIKGLKINSFEGTPDLYEVRIDNENYLMTYAKTDPNPSAPSVVNSSGKVKISWSKVKNVDGYEIYMSVSKNGHYSQIGSVKASKTSFLKSGLTVGKTYYFKVRSYKLDHGKKVYGDFTKPISKRAQ